jgi:hypothetical protein
MGILKDWKEDTNGYVFTSRVAYFFSPKVWLRLHKWRKQRADRGWSDRDTWGAGDHIARMTAEMLQHLNDESYCDWPEWFRLNVKEEGKGAYKDLQSVIDDINQFLDFTHTTWADGLSPKPKSEGLVIDGVYNSPNWVEDETGKTLTEAAVKRRITKHADEWNRRYKKANKAMGFFGRHFTSFWD